MKVDGAPYPVTVDGKTYKVPASCCNRFSDVSENAVENCRINPYSGLPEGEELSGCFDKFEDLLNDNKDKILIVGVVIVVIMVRIAKKLSLIHLINLHFLLPFQFLNMLFAFAMCTMAN